MMTDVSIVIINWNTREVLRNCLASVFEGRTGLSVEVLVIDNASTDGSAEMVARSFPQVKLTVNAENRGFAAANNMGIRTASGRYILLLNSDTVLLRDVLARSMQYMDEHPRVGVFGCRVLNADLTLQLTCQRYPSVLNCFIAASGLTHLPWPQLVGREQMLDWRRDDEREVDVVSGCYMLVRSEAVRTVGLLDEAFFFCGEEADWCKRFRYRGWQLRFAPVGEIIHIGNVSG
jgi:GT2 family glycosyltransferase